MSYEAWGDNDDGDYMTVDQAVEAGWLSPDAYSNAAMDVLNERIRQTTEEGFDARHDDQHASGEIASAAACYAAGEVYRRHDGQPYVGAGRFVSFAPLWPWAREWWKPKDRRRDLVRAGALIIAEIERLDRADEAVRRLKAETLADQLRAEKLGMAVGSPDVGLIP